MRLAVCGLGKVGKPLLEMFRIKGFEATGYDIDPKLSEVSLSDAVESSDATFYIVPTPSLPDGSFSNEYLASALKCFGAEVRRHRKRRRYLHIVVSTTVPGSCDKLYGLVDGDDLCYKPEFIRLEHVREDLLTPSFVLIGENCKHAGDVCEVLYRQITDVPIKRMSLIEAELAKITLNCALTMKISLANQLWRVAKKVGANADAIMDAVGSDPRIGNAYLKPGEPYGGPCLPRDNAMFRYFAATLGVSAPLSRAADDVNERIKEDTK